MPAPKPSEMIPLRQIRIDGGTQARVGLSESTVTEYADVLQGGGKLPDATVFFDGSHHWMGDGFHRFHAHRKAGLGEISCQVHLGTQRDAMLFAVGANATHGLQRSIPDKRRAVEILLNDEEWGQKSTEWIAQNAKVSWSLVDRVRKELSPESPPTVQGRDGRTHAAKRPGESLPAPEAAGNEEPEPSVRPLPAREADDAIPAMEPDGGFGPVESEAVVTDAMHRPVPAKLVPVFQAMATFRSLVRQIGTIQTAVGELHKQPSGVRLHPNTVRIDLDNAQSSIRFAAPYVVCPECDGDGCRGKNSLCGSHGWLPESSYSHLTADEKQKCEAHKRGK